MSDISRQEFQRRRQALVEQMQPRQRRADFCCTRSNT